MPVFSYRATDDQGRVVDGQLDARNHDAVVERLRRLALYPLDIRASEEAEGGGQGKPLLRWRRGRKVAYFTAQMATLLEAGLPLDRSLAIAQELTDDKDFAAVIGRVRRSVEEGSTLADSLKAEGSSFDELSVNMVRAGESGGVLEIVLRRLAEFQEESQRIRDFIASALAYPVFLILFSGAALTLIFVAVLPRFTQVFTDLGDVLPLPARILMAVSAAVGKYWWAGLLGVVGAALVARGWIRTPEGRRWWDTSRLSWPLVGDLIAKMETARFARTLGTLLSSGVPVLQAVDIVGAIIRNRHLASFMADVKNGLRRGEGLVAPLKRTGAFPSLFLHMVTVGEETGRMEDMLLKVATIYEREVESTTKGLLSLVEPVILVVLGVLLGGIIVSVLWAIFSVYSISF